MRSFGRYVLAGFAAVALSGCMQDTAPPEATTASVPAGGSIEQQINAFRASEGRGAVKASGKLTKAAQMHAQDMVAKDYFNHVSPSGETLIDRAGKVGYGYCTIAENIAFGYLTDARAFDSWVKSDGHRANLLNGKHDQYGFARAGDKYVLVLGSDGC